MGIFGAAKRGFGMLGKPRGVFKVKRSKTHGKEIPTMAAKGGRIGFKKAGPVSPINIPWTKPGEIPSQKPRTRKFAGALVRGAKNIVKHTPWRKELAGLKKTHRTKQKILKGRAARKEASSKAALAPNYGPYGKKLASQAQHPKSWRRAGKT